MRLQTDADWWRLIESLPVGYEIVIPIKGASFLRRKAKG